MEGNRKEVPEWVTLTYQKFVEIIEKENPRFPCIYARKAFQNHSLFFTYIEPFEIDSPLEFLDSFRQYSLETNLKSEYTALIVFIKTKLQNQALQYYKDDFWKLLQFIHNNDLSPWVIEIPKDPNNYNWQFCFNGISFFINAHSSAYRKRMTRFAPCDLMLVIQPSKNLIDLKMNVSSVDSISKIIRKFVNQYDSMNISKVFGLNFADSEVYNWKQYWLEEDDTNLNEKKCPLIIH